MGQIKIFGNKKYLKDNKKSISDSIHEAVVEALEYPSDKKFHRFFPMESEDFLYPKDRSEKYLVVEISIFEGRTIEAKKKLISLIYKKLNENLEICGTDVEITIFETPKHNWGIRGVCGDELALNYKVEV